MEYMAVGDQMKDDIIAFAYKLYQCGILELQEFNKVIHSVAMDDLSDILALIED